MTTLDARTTAPAPTRRPIDARGPRFGAVITTVVLAVTLLTIPSTLSLVLLSLQTVAFALGSLVGVHAQPYGVLFRKVVRPRLGAPTKLEDPAPPRFAQTVGLGLRARRPPRARHRRDHARLRRGRLRARCGVPQRRVRLLPRLRDVPPRQAPVRRSHRLSHRPHDLLRGSAAVRTTRS